MNDRARRRHDLFKRVLRFWEDPDQPQRRLSPESKASEALAGLRTTVDGLELADARKAEGAGEKSGGTTAKSVLADSLRLDLQNISRTARSIAEDQPGYDGPFAPPANTGYSALETTTRAYLAVLGEPGEADKFIAHDLPAGFVADLAADLEALGAADDDQADGLDQQVIGTAATSRLVSTGMKHLRALDAVAHNRFSRQPDDLRAWQSASHLERSAQRPAAASPTGNGHGTGNSNGNGNDTPSPAPAKA